MAYKFQLGTFVASGSIKAESGFDAADQNISNVGDIALDTISADGNEVGISMTDNQQDAFVVKEGNTVYFKCDTRNGSEAVIINKKLEPAQDGLWDLGSSTKEFKDLYIDGVAYVDDLRADALGAALDCNNQTMTNVDINSGAIDGTAIGAAAQAAGSFTTVSGSGNATIGGNLAVDGAQITFPGMPGDAALAVGADELLFRDATDDGKIKRESVSDLASAMAGDGLAASSGVFAVQVDDTGIEINSDSLRLKDNGVTLAKMAGITRGSIILGDSSGDPSLLAKGTAAQFLQSDGTDPSYVTISGDASVAAGGALTIANDAVESGMLNDNVISGQTALTSGLALTDEFLVSDAGTVNRMDVSVLAEAIDGAGLSNNAGLLDVDAAQAGITSIYNAALKVGYGASDAHIDFSTDNKIIFDVDATQAFEINGTGVVVAGNLTVQGTTTTIDSTTVNVSSSFTFEGAANAHETTLHAGGDGTGDDPVADTTLYLPALAAGNYYVPALADKATAASAAVTAAEFALLDGGSSVGSTALASGDGFMHNDNGTMKHTTVDKIADLFAGDGISASSAVLALDVNGMATATAAGGLAAADLFAHYDADAGAMKKVQFQHVYNHIFGTVSGDATIADGGALTIGASAVEAGMLNNNCISGKDDINDPIANTDELLISDAGTLKRTDMSRLKTYIGSGTSAVALKDDGDTLAVGVNYFGSHGGAESATLPASAGMTVGESVKIKAGSDCSSTNTLTVNKAGSQTIDGATEIVLESPYSAVELVYVAADTWRVF